MSLATYLVTEPVFGHPKGAEIQLNDTDANPHVGKALVRKDAEEQKTADGSFADVVKSVIRSEVQDVIRQENATLKSKGRPKGLVAGVHDHQPGEPRDEKNFGEWARALGWASIPSVGPSLYQKGIDLLSNKYASRKVPNFMENWGQSQKWADQETVDKTVQVETVGALGGFAVPPEFLAKIWELVDIKSTLASRVDRYPMTGLDMYIPAVDYSLGGSGASPYLAGMSGSWLAEGQTFAATNMQIRQMHLKANLFGAITQSTRTLLADNNVGIERMLTGLFAKVAAFYLDKAIFSGNGVGQPRGITNSAAGIAVSRTGAASGTMLKDLSIVASHLLPDEGAASRAFWLAPPSAKQALYQMTDGSGRVVWLPSFPGANVGPAGTRVDLLLFGMPVIFSQFPASSGTATDFTLIDPMGYILGLREDLEVAVSEHVGFTSNLLTWRFLIRADGQSALNTYLTLANGDTVSPFCWWGS